MQPDSKGPSVGTEETKVLASLLKALRGGFGRDAAGRHTAISANADAPKIKRPPHRPEIDGLRSIAVLAVLLYHFSVPGFGGGFVGVDIFFVISGFLIGSILWAEVSATGNISLANFYSRRFRRLAPAYVAATTATLIVGVFIYLPFEFRELGKTVIAATVYLSNFYFFSKAGYFDTASEHNALLHTWSLAIEEQFYVFLPLFLLVLARRRAVVLPLLIALGVASLLACVFFTAKSHTAAFYLFPFRAWELLAGVCYGILLAQRPDLSERRLPQAVSWIGLVLIGLSLAFIQPGVHFPGFQAILPVVGTLLVIAAGQSDNAVNRALSSPGAVTIGLMSYSLYLWHWPILTLSTYYRDGYQGPLETAFWLAVTFAVSWCSWKFIENPIRFSKALGRKELFASVVASSFLLIGVGAAVYRLDGLPNRFDRDVLVHVEAGPDFIQDFSRCFTPQDGAFSGIELCAVGSSGREPTFLAWGDSHGRAIMEGLDLAAREVGASGLLIWEGGCPPLIGVEKSESASTLRNDQACTRQNRQIADALEASPQLDRVLLVGRWPYYTAGAGVGADSEDLIELAPSSTTEETQVQTFSNLTVSTISELNAQGKEVYVLRAVPEVAPYDSRDLARLLAHGKLKTESEIAPRVEVPLRLVEERSAASDGVFMKLADAGKVTLLDPWADLCDDEACYALSGDEAFYFDNNHLTNTGARHVRGVFLPLLTPDAVGQ